MIYRNKKQNYDPINFETLEDDDFDRVPEDSPPFLTIEELEVLHYDLVYATESFGFVWFGHAVQSVTHGETIDSESYPQHPGEPDCSYYIRTGLCRFGATCRFNHAPDI
ncbi:zinc finger C-x8-C-x5-C-x3-H type family protein [Medicago truncatula]|uniref:Zinc finger C-x8-C-x5-C-x3-H type family protein n=1 Tax=Medicago truncatula TaxID=3880 RepID=A0A072VNG7_MEDTR|nr:zinc finger C-x8-C-x5-C-x3-H type family protein [Medicago truncatula]